MKTIRQYQLEAAVINDALSFSDEIIKSMENLGAHPTGISTSHYLVITQNHILDRVKYEFEEVYKVDFCFDDDDLDANSEEHFMYCVGVMEDIIEEKCGQIVLVKRCHPKKSEAAQVASILS